MKKLMSGLLATTLAASFAVASAIPANAAPVFVPKSDTAQRTDVQTVQYDPWRRAHRMDRRFDHRVDRRIDRRFDRRFARNDGYYNGYRGYRSYHHGYRRHGDLWFPAAAFLAGALITGAIVNDNAPRYSGNSHVSWCYDHYRSYRAYDNTFNPGKNRPRQVCYSPYD